MKKILFFILTILFAQTVSAEVQNDFESILQTVPQTAHIKAEFYAESPDGISELYCDGIVTVSDKTLKVYADITQDGEAAELWADIDMSENCKYYAVLKSPSAENYITFDFARLPAIRQLMQAEDDKETILTAETDKSGKCTVIELENDDFKLYCEIEEAEEPIQIVFPEITDENSADLTALSVENLNVSEINLLYNDTLIEFEEIPVIENGRTFLPLRKLANTFGIPDDNIAFDGKTREVTVSYGEYDMRLTIGSNKAYVNGIETEFDAPAFIRYDRTYLPLRFIAESFGKEVDWLPIEDVTGEKLSGSLIIMTDK